MADYIPQSYSGFRAWITNFMHEITVNGEAWGLPAAEITALGTEVTAYLSIDAFAESAEATRPARKQRETAFKAVVKKVRRFVNKFVNNNDAIGPAARAALGVTVYDGARTPVGVPWEHVGLTILPANAREHLIKWTVQETGSKAVPGGYDGVVLRKQVLEDGEPVPEEQAALSYSKLLTRNNWIETFRTQDQGKRCAYTACWQNEKGEEGPWSDVIIVIVP